MSAGRLSIATGRAFGALERKTRQTIEERLNDPQMNGDPTLAEIMEEHPSVFRECAERFMRVLHSAIERQPDTVQKWGIAFATNNPICLGRSMSEIASLLGESRAALSFEARKFCDDNGLPPSSYMRSEAAIVTAQKARNETVSKLAQKIRTTKNPLR